MNTTEKGDQFEDLAFDVFDNMIKEDCFFAKSECCEIFRKKGYYSKDRDSDIVFDISIEIKMPGRNHYTALYLIECKNYAHTIPVDDVEEFFAKTQQISGANIKAVVVATNAFQKSAHAFAKSKGIGLLRFFDKEQREWVLDRSPSSMATGTSNGLGAADIRMALLEEFFRSKFFDFYGYSNDTYTVSSNQFFFELARQNADNQTVEELAVAGQATQEARLRVPFIEKARIEKTAAGILSMLQHASIATPLQSVCDHLKAACDLSVERMARLAEGVLGQISFNPDTILIDDQQAETRERQRFTLAHELGHYALGHKSFITRESCSEIDLDPESSGRRYLREVRRLEWQANYFASCLLLPRDSFQREFFKRIRSIGLTDRGYGHLYVDNQACNQKAYFEVTSRLMSMFGVSRSAIRIRMLDLGLLNESKTLFEMGFVNNATACLKL